MHLGRLNRYWLAAIAVSVLSVAIAAFLFSRPLPPPRVLTTTQITSDRRPKNGPFLTDGSRLYFNAADSSLLKPYEVSSKGGDSVPFPIQLKNARLLEISPDHSDLLVGTFEESALSSASPEMTLWIVPVMEAHHAACGISQSPELHGRPTVSI